MLFMDVPPDVPPQYVPVIVAQAFQEQQSDRTDRTIGECHLVNTIKESRGVDQWKSPIYSFNPIETVNAYFAIIEKRNIGLEGKIALLQGPEHGAMKEEWNQNYRYIPNSDYLGSDRATFLVEIGGLKVKVVYHFKVIDGGAIGGTEADDKQNCPKGMFWKISTTSDASGNLIVSSVDYQTPITNAAGNEVVDTTTLALTLGSTILSGTSGIKLNIADISAGAVGQTTGSSITLDTNAANYNWFIDATPGSNEEFLPTSNPYEWVAKEGTAAYGKMDMLSVLLHEYGHALGIEHSADSHDYMATTLTAGVHQR